MLWSCSRVTLSVQICMIHCRARLKLEPCQVCGIFDFPVILDVTPKMFTWMVWPCRMSTWLKPQVAVSSCDVSKYSTPSTFDLNPPSGLEWHKLWWFFSNLNKNKLSQLPIQRRTKSKQNLPLVLHWLLTLFNTYFNKSFTSAKIKKPYWKEGEGRKGVAFQIISLIG